MVIYRILYYTFFPLRSFNDKRGVCDDGTFTYDHRINTEFFGPIRKRTYESVEKQSIKIESILTQEVK